MQSEENFDSLFLIANIIKINPTREFAYIHFISQADYLVPKFYYSFILKVATCESVNYMLLPSVSTIHLQHVFRQLVNSIFETNKTDAVYAAINVLKKKCFI